MKHFVQPRNAILRENHTSEVSSPNPSSVKQRSSSRKNKGSKENAPPADLNAILDSPALASGKPSPATMKMKSPLPPRPPSSNSLKRKFTIESVPENGVLGSSDSGVKVILRVRPPSKDEEEGELIIQKTATDSLSILGQTFTFDSVADTESTQLEIFQLVGAPLVENCLAGFNSSVFAYGQTGSGKTYTMWGPANALLEENLSSDQQGLTPRVFERLFARINEEQINHADTQLTYQCRCSFLEIYNEQITDLLDPSQRNLQIREDVKSGVYVENLTEECVSTMKDVTQLLIKGLSNRRTGSTSINAESSRSHSVFTCVVESRCKRTADGLSSFKTSRINLVDLAGSERQKLTGAAGERLKEAGNINRSLSQLGNLINILAEVSQTGKQRHIPYRDSRLTFLLQESLGGNAKLAMVCAVSPAQSCKSETLSTLRFAQRAKAIKNKAIVNEVMQDDVNFLREVIRQLKDELLRMKANANQTDPNGGYSTGWNARRSLNLLKFSLNRPMTLPHVDEDSDEEMEIVDECEQVSIQSAGREANNVMSVTNLETEQSNSHDFAFEEGNIGEPQPNTSESACIEIQGSKDIDVVMDEEPFDQVDNNHEGITVGHREHFTNTPHYSEADATEHHNHTEGNDKDSSRQPSQEHLNSSVSNLLNEESPSKQMGDDVLLNRKYENHPEVMRTKIELKRIQDELERYRNFFDMGERDVLLEEIQDLRSQLQYYVDTSPNLARKRRSLLQLTYSCEPSAPPPLCTIPESTEESLEQKLKQERICWMEAESKWISLAEELRIELEASRFLAEKQKQELDSEKKCSEELKEAMQMAMQGHARMLEQYADLEEKHIQLLARHRKIQDGIDDVKKAASKAGVRGAESKFINALAAEISALKVEREKERRYFRDENKGLQAQLRDTADAVQAAGELLVRLKEADEAVAAAEKRAMEAEQEAVKAYKQIDKLKKKHEKEIISLNQLVAESRLPKEAIRPVYDDSDVVKYDAGESPNTDEKRWREEFEPFYNAEEGELSKLAVPSSWFSGYDRCNI
ncbi:Kinesin-like protein [Actinidia chinensis var. chinensis]|uniref:Kinesin-like protein n=1 Tax=Actinidia chinensis var. chinensis TaxID=1590841 RepID=A0A2R6RRH5_ACTCC|nr:Kinesin-like protein [Actinidia chinensis var. chinensis]